ncbi:MAG: mechanosensitive ion channel family protein [Alphaproteobacteria bacterium]|nr:mechanosensitive ion channel family protein [Alphaproteobacteria bacterium]MCB9696160.1 mechanosensitive ion channel family protein [Alphaproteobacteria bacterium]
MFRTIRPSRALLVLVAALLALLGTARAQTSPCANPQSAADSLFEPLTRGRWEPNQAAVCFDLPPNVDGGRRAAQLKQLLDARGLFMPVHTLSLDPEYRDEAGSSTVVPLAALPQIALVRGQDGLWRYSRATVEDIPRLYAETFSPLSVWFQSRLPPIFYVDLFGLHPWQLVYAVLLIALAWAVGTASRAVLRTQVLRVMRRAGLALDEKTWQRTQAPTVALAVFAFLWWGLSDLMLPIRYSEPLTRTLWVGVWISGVIVALRGVAVGAGVAASWAQKTDSKLDDQAIPMLRQATQLVVLVLGTLYTADAMGFDVWKLAAGVGIGGLAFALAAQDTVANLFGSINIFLDRPFQIGDWVKIGAVEGVVEEVGFRSTRVRTFYNSLVTIPNSQITSANVDNLGVRPRRRVKMMLGLTYDTPPDLLQAYVEGVRAILACHPKVQRTYEVHVNEFSACSIDILVYYHVVTPSWSEELDTKAQNMLEFMRLAKELGVSFAFPSTSVYLESTPEHPLPARHVPDPDELRATFDAFGPAGELARPGGPVFGRSWSVPARAAAEDRGSAE